MLTLFCSQGVAVVVSCTTALLWDVSYSRIKGECLQPCTPALLRCVFGRELSVRKKVSLPVEQTTLSHASLLSIEHKFKKSKLDNLLLSYNLYSTVNFSTKIHNNSITAIDNIFIDKVKYENYSIHPLVSRLSDHDSQIITINNLWISIRKFNKFSVSQLAVNLSYENWVNVFVEEDVNTVFNNFLNTHLRIFNSSFLLQKVCNTHNNKPWITT